MQKMQEIQGIVPALLDFWQEKSGKPSHEKTSQFRKNPFPSPQELPPVQPKDLWYNGAERRRLYLRQPLAPEGSQNTTAASAQPSERIAYPKDMT